MKTVFWCTLLLPLFGQARTAFAQDAAPPAGSQFTVGLSLANLKVKDLQASPLLYVANPKGLQLAYERRSAASRFRAEFQASTGAFVAPAVGPRKLTFTDEDITGTTTSNSFVLAPTLYQGTLEVSYLRRLNTANAANKWRSFVGLSLHNRAAYADGVALTTWALNAATLNVAAAGEWHLRPGHLLTLQGALPLGGAVTRLPYNNTLSYPDSRSYAHLFFAKGTQLATWNRLQRLQWQASYEVSVSRRLNLSAQYQGEWFHYSRPRSVTALSNQLTAQVSYKF